MTAAPIRVAWTAHAEAKADLLSISRGDVSDLLLADHANRSANSGAGRWRVASAWLTVVYDHPDGDDPTTARIITIWRRG